MLSLTLAVLPALAVYNFLPGTSLGMFLILIVSFSVIITRRRIKIAKDECFLFLSILLVSFLSLGYHVVAGSGKWFDFSVFINNLYGIFICFLPLIFSIQYADIKALVNTLYTVGILASVVIIWQRLSLFATGSFVQEVFLPGFEINRAIESMTISRPSAFFTEPAHFCIFLLPVLYLSLRARNVLFSALFLFAVLCSGSTTGFLMSAGIVIYNIYNRNRRHRLWVMILAVILFALAYFSILIFYPQILLENIEKLSGVQDGDSDIRLFGPLMYLSYFDEVEWVLGITLNQLEGFLFSFGVEGKNYANAMIFMIISYGIVGFLALIFYLCKKWKSQLMSKGLLLVFGGILFSDQILFNAHFLYLASLTLLAPRIFIYMDTGRAENDC